jgi:hypothetical protein
VLPKEEKEKEKTKKNTWQNSPLKPSVPTHFFFGNVKIVYSISLVVVIQIIFFILDELQ